jgi:ribosomal protein S30
MRHCGLAKAGKVKRQTILVEKTAEPKKSNGRAKKRQVASKQRNDVKEKIYHLEKDEFSREKRYLTKIDRISYNEVVNEERFNNTKKPHRNTETHRLESLYLLE